MSSHYRSSSAQTSPSKRPRAYSGHSSPTRRVEGIVHSVFDLEPCSPDQLLEQVRQAMHGELGTAHLHDTLRGEKMGERIRWGNDSGLAKLDKMDVLLEEMMLAKEERKEMKARLDQDEEKRKEMKARLDQDEEKRKEMKARLDQGEKELAEQKSFIQGQKSFIQEQEEINQKQLADIMALKASSQGYRAIRNRRMARFALDVLGKPQPGDNETVRVGNAAAHRADPEGDAALYRERIRSDDDAFTELYGITWEEALDYANHHDTMRAVCQYADIKSERADIPWPVIQAFEAFIAAWRAGGRPRLYLDSHSHPVSIAYRKFQRVRVVGLSGR